MKELDKACLLADYVDYLHDGKDLKIEAYLRVKSCSKKEVEELAPILKLARMVYFVFQGRQRIK